MTKTKLPIRSITCIALLAGVPIACDKKSEASGNLDASGLDAASRPPVREGVLGPLPVVKVKIHGETFTLEVADEEHEKAQGLMYRKSMPAQHGMIFVWQSAEPRGFWMKDTELTLDLVFLNSAAQVVAIQTGRPFDKTNIASSSPARFVIEFNHGTANRIGLKLGDVIDLPKTLR